MTSVADWSAAEQRPMPEVEGGAGAAQLTAGALPHPLGEQRVLVEPTGVEVLGQADDEHRVEVEADRVGDRRHQDTLAETADPGEGRLELQSQDLLEAGDAGRPGPSSRAASPARARSRTPAAYCSSSGMRSRVVTGTRVSRRLDAHSAKAAHVVWALPCAMRDCSSSMKSRMDSAVWRLRSARSVVDSNASRSAARPRWSSM